MVRSPIPGRCSGPTSFPPGRAFRLPPGKRPRGREGRGVHGPGQADEPDPERRREAPRDSELEGAVPEGHPGGRGRDRRSDSERRGPGAGGVPAFGSRSSRRARNLPSPRRRPGHGRPGIPPGYGRARSRDPWTARGVAELVRTSPCPRRAPPGASRADQLADRIYRAVNYRGTAYYEIPSDPARYGKTTPEELEGPDLELPDPPVRGSLGLRGRSSGADGDPDGDPAPDPGPDRYGSRPSAAIRGYVDGAVSQRRDRGDRRRRPGGKIPEPPRRPVPADLRGPLPGAWSS
ncbi:MAG: hypothetical protein M0C28_48560 [Candidatus Moduliflexus flocculans]|nr:hypothetical protein [Candidatus Moduliflexus flocculans]